jgi:hypothetical protein
MHQPWSASSNLTPTLSPPRNVQVDEPSPQSSTRSSTRFDAVLAFAARSPLCDDEEKKTQEREKTEPHSNSGAGSPPRADAWSSGPLPPYQPPQTSTVQLVKGEPPSRLHPHPASDTTS